MVQISSEIIAGFAILIVAIVVFCILYIRHIIKNGVRTKASHESEFERTLTPTEKLVFNELKNGYDSKTIASFTGIGSPRTVDGHIANIVKKARCESRLRLVALANRQEL